jgi:2-iminobutanoate/2-iminopropanoate deaminase
LVAGAGVAATYAHEGATGPTRKVLAGSPLPFFSRAVAFGQLVFISGVMGNKPGTRELAAASFEGQCKQAMENMKASIEAAGSKLSSVLKCTCFLTDAADFEKFNEVYATYFTTDPPARSTVVVNELVLAGAKMEIECVTCTA